MKIANKIFLVTGAGSGIGKALVRELTRRGAKVVAIDLNENSLNQLEEELSSEVVVAKYPLDITDRSAVEKIKAEIERIGIDIDGLINCAGVIQPFVKVNDLDYADIEKVMNVNFYGTVYLTKTFLPDLLKRAEAHIVNVSSMGGFLPVPGQSVYGASKAAVKLFTEGLYAELLNTMVRVSVVFPGATNTNIATNSNVNLPVMENIDKSKVPMLSAEKAAQLIADGIEKNRTQIFTGKDSKTMNLLYRLNPIFAIKLIARKMHSLLG